MMIAIERATAGSSGSRLVRATDRIVRSFVKRLTTLEVRRATRVRPP
jgi:hypothetical protein